MSSFTTRSIIPFTLAIFLAINSYGQNVTKYKIKYSYDGLRSGSSTAEHNLKFNISDSTFIWSIKKEHTGCFLSHSESSQAFTGKYQIDRKKIRLDFILIDTTTDILSKHYSEFRVKKNKLKALGNERHKRHLGHLYIKILRDNSDEKGYYNSSLKKYTRTITFPFRWIYYKGIYVLRKPKIRKPNEVP